MDIVIVLKNDHSESRFSLNLEPFRTVLDGLEKIRGGEKPDLIYRHSCHHGSCGTCGAMINDKPRLMCLTKVGDFEGEEIIIEPLRQAMSLEGIAVWPGALFENLPDTGYLREVDDESAPGSLQAAGSLQASVSAFLEIPDIEKLPRRLEDCIECGLCVAACPVERDFAGPAALAAAEIELGKDPSRTAEMLAFAGKPDGARKCERFFGCSRACPQGIAPGRRISNLLKLLR
ncbi:MAG: 2Fe-2S iron-sulfur cluster-binding protein [Spirochaetales bacterium]|jgi:succinate dehydrogenase / fumarate reductase iron-sulfur subunit